MVLTLGTTLTFFYANTTYNAYAAYNANTTYNAYAAPYLHTRTSVLSNPTKRA